MIRLALIAAAGVLTMASTETSARVVETEQGNVASTTAKREGVVAWHGIPYAAPPVGERRWRPPAPPEPWEGVRSGAEFGHRCMQTNPFPDMIWNSPGESEDCLNLSIWAPEDADGLPVLFWIHGGGFLSGSGDEARHDGSALADLGAVVVTINYRLGIFGFFAHPALSAESSTGSSGNYAFMDMIAALEWVRDNIAVFGGDSGNVTIFGESAGSLAVSGLMVTPASKGLFHKAIGQSGSLVNGKGVPVTRLADAEAAGEQLLRDLGKHSLDGLRNLPAADLIQASDTWRGGAMPPLDGTVFPEPPLIVFSEGRQHDVPLIAGWTSAETKWVNVDLEGLAQLRKETYPDHLEKAERLYPATTDAEARDAGIQLSSDSWMGYSTWKWLSLHASTGTSPVFRFVFDHVQATTDGSVPADDPGAGHATDIPFTFNALDVLGQPVGESDRTVAELMGRYWVNFARTGNPNGTGLPEWPSVNGKDVQPVMWLGDPPAVRDEHDRARLELVGASRGD